MSLQDELKAKALALVSQQMANWVVEIQRSIAQHQADLVRSLDVLQETVARYDERIDEASIAHAMEDVVAHQPPPQAAGPGCEKLRASLTEIDKGTSLSEVLTHLVTETSGYLERAAMFIVKGTSAIGWYGRGFDQPELVKQLNIPLNADTMFRIVQNSRHALRGHITHSPGTAQALARLGGNPQGVLAVPLVLRDKLSAILYCDTQEEEVPAGVAALVDILVLYAAKTIDIISQGPKQATQPGTAPSMAAPAAARISSGSTMERAAAIRAAAPPPAPAPAAAGEDEGSSTLMFRGMPTPRPSAAPPPAAAPAVAPRAASPAVSPEDQKAHEDAKRFARLVVSEIKLYNEQKVIDGRRQKNIYEVLKEDIERGRQMYSDRVPAHVRDSANYFYDELVRILAGGDASALGPI